jgi:hypothetical protein
MELIQTESNLTNNINDYYVVQDKLTNRKYVVMHIINGKFAIYDYDFHDVIKIFKWYPNNGYACSILKQEHVDQLENLPAAPAGTKKSIKRRERKALLQKEGKDPFPFEINRPIFMHLLIKVYILNEPQVINNKHDEFRTVFHHINGWKRDNRIENIMWIGRFEQISIFKVFGKLYKPPPEVRYLNMYLPKYVQWINAKRCYRINEHPVIFQMVRLGTSKHKYIESKKGKKHTAYEKYIDVMEKYEMLQNSPYYTYPSYINFLETMEYLKLDYKTITGFVIDSINQSVVHDIVQEIFDKLVC